MANVSRMMVERAGIDVDMLLEKLVRNAAAEFTTYYYYTILRNYMTGIDGDSLKEIAEAARIEDRNHFEALVPRIYELGGDIPKDMVKFHEISACPPASLPNPPTLKNILEVLLEAERCAVIGYSEIANMTAGKDHRTYDLVTAILNEEIEHEAWFEEMLTGNPSGHYKRVGETSPYVRKFLQSS